MTQVQLAAKRSERNAASRAKAKERRRLAGEAAQAHARMRIKHSEYMAELGLAQLKQEERVNELRKQARESRRTDSTIPGHGPQGVIGRIKSFFKGRGR